MSSIGTGYDLSVSTYSPDGRLFQVEYANKAVEAAGVAIGLKCADGVILATERLLHSKLLVKGANRRIQSIDEHIGMATAGLLADGKHLGSRGREEAGNFRENYNAPITVQVDNYRGEGLLQLFARSSGKYANDPVLRGYSLSYDVRILADRLSAYTQAYTCYGSVRPFGISTLVAGVDKTGPRLFCIEPSGVYYGYRATAAGKGKALAKTELEKLLNKQTGEAGQGVEGMTVREGVMEVARIVHLVHDDNKDKDFELEMTWVCAESNWKHAAVPQELLVEAERKAREALEMGMEED